METERTFTAFAGERLLASGPVREVLLRTKQRLDKGEDLPVLVFDDRTGRTVDFDLRGTPEEALARLDHHPLFAPPEGEGATKVRAGPGRPKLGVVCREVSLLPRHWEWLDEQPGGMSATLRKLVDEARKRGDGRTRARAARDAAGAFMWTMAGNLPGFEEASRALFALDAVRLKQLMRGWPADVRKHLDRLVQEAVRLDAEAAKSAADSAPST